MSTTKYHEVAASAIVEAGQVAEKLAELMGHLSVQFTRWEPVVQAGKYVRGLLSDLPRKNCWTLAEYAGDATPDRMQRLLERASWDTLAAMGTVRDFVAAHLAGEGGGPAMLVLDESGVEKTGTATCGVKRQYVGCAGKVANAVNLVNATYSTDRGHALIGSRIYLPAEHLEDSAARKAMGIPDDLQFRTKPQLGADLLADAVEAGVQVDWCTGDAVYGRDRTLREACEKRGIGYSLGIPCSFRIRLPSGLKMRADTAAKLSAGGWQIASCGPGSKGDRRYQWAWLATASPRHFLLIRRSLRKPSELAYFYCWVPDDVPATLGVLTAVTGRRWTIEEDHQFGKDQFGYDHFQTRLHTPILRHLVLVMAALAVCAVACADARSRAEPAPTPTTRTQPPPIEIGLIPLTVIEIKRLFNLVTRAWRSIEHHLHWSGWRRRHQARARWYHHRARLT